MNKTYRNEDNLKQAVEMLADRQSISNMCHMRLCGEPLPSQQAVRSIIDLTRMILFPGFFGSEGVNSYNLEYVIGIRCEELNNILTNQITAALALQKDCGEAIDLPRLEKKAADISMRLIGQLPEMRRVLHTDVSAIYRGDPAAASHEEVIYCYPSIRAITNYRIAHALHVMGVPVLPRMISEMAHSETGIDIHPGATIGEYFAIDHGTGVVIGATAIIGKNVKIYQGVTLGAKSFDCDPDGNPLKGIDRHPIIGDDVVIYSNASILGRITIGNGAVIGGNLWVTEDIAPGEKLIQAKANNILRFKQDI